MYAIVSHSGRQYKVQEGMRINVDRLPNQNGEEILLNNVLFVKKDEGEPLIGMPTVMGASVVAVVSRQFRSPKIFVFKKRPKKGYKKKIGHRQDLTELEIKKINIS
ncbi:MAG: 50S ribosomal protein L21 [Elusimicrobiota bacterium]